MSNLGLGVMINMLSGGGAEETVAALEEAKKNPITDVKIQENSLRISFEGGKTLRLWDDGQSCCENRYMHSDDDLSYYAGATLQEVEVSGGPKEEGEYGDLTESQFLIVTTSKGAFTVVNYNSHNGYYGGFWIKGELEEQ